ncbi:hypothetical protein WL93_09595 [Burkholderia diffusa]|nr:hypothetical protein WL93_09595 [Burkholderia diffusa]
MWVGGIQIEKITRLPSAQIFKYLEGFEKRDKRAGWQPDLVRLGKRFDQRLSMCAQRLLSLRCGCIRAAYHLSFTSGEPPRIDIQELGRE